jgi:hypothetical protein
MERGLECYYSIYFALEQDYGLGYEAREMRKVLEMTFCVGLR